MGVYTVIRIVLLLLLWPLPASAGWQSRDSNYDISISGAAPSYTGPGDCVGGWLTWVGFNAYSAAYANGTNNAADLVDTATGLTTYTAKMLSTGLWDAAGAAASTACATSCKVTKFYDQTGGTNHFTNATLSSMPTIVFSHRGGLADLQWTASPASLLNAPTITQAQPFSFVVFANRSPSAASSMNTIASNGGNTVLQFSSSANAFILFGGGLISATATDTNFHAFQGVFNGASPNSILRVDATETTGSSGAGTMAAALSMGYNGGNPLIGFMNSAGAIAAALTPTQRTCIANAMSTW